MKSTRMSLATLALGFVLSSANAATRYVGTWEVSNGDGGTLTMYIDGSLISGSMNNPGKIPIPGRNGTATMSGSFTGHRFKVFVTYSNGMSAWYQGNIDIDGGHLRMDGLRYFGDKPDVKTSIMVDASWAQ